MKRIILALLLLPAALSAQITIKQSDMPKAGDAPIYSTSSMPLDDSATGANHTWDFTSLVPESNDTFPFSKPEGMYAFLFFNHVAMKGNAMGQEGFAFFKSNATEWSLAGVGFEVPGMGMGLPIKLEKNDRILKLPLSYQDTWTDTFGTRQSMSGFTFAMHGRRKSKVDGYGTVKTPFGTFSCLRVKSMVHELDTIQMDTMTIPFDNSRIEYRWLATGHKIPVMQIDVRATPFGNIQTITYEDSFRNFPDPFAPKADFAASDSNLIIGDTVHFRNYSSGMVNSFEWGITPDTGYKFVDTSSATSPEPGVIFNRAGKYTVSLTAIGFSGSDKKTKTDYITVSATGIEEQQDFAKRFRLLPNPSNGRFMLLPVVGLQTNLHYRLLDAQGREVQRGTIPAGAMGHSFDLTREGKGLYLLEVQSAGMRSAAKVVVE